MQTQKRRREKIPVNLLEERSDHCSMVTPAIESDQNKNLDMTAETSSCSTENPPEMTKAHGSDCSSILLGGSKCVRICEDTPISIHDPPG